MKLAGEFTLPAPPGEYLKAKVLTGSCSPYKTTSASTGRSLDIMIIMLIILFLHSFLIKFCCVYHASLMLLLLLLLLLLLGSSSISAASQTPIEDQFPLESFNIYTDCNRHHQQVPVFVGELYKRGHGHKTWKRRKIQFSGRRIKYFEKTTFKGDFDVRGCTIEVPITAESGAPTQFQFILHSQNTKDASLICCAETDDVRNLWIRLVNIQSRMLTASASCMNCPPVRVGFMKKQGHVMRNWQKRYFVLDMGILRYYEKSAGKGLGEKLKGEIGLAGARVDMQGGDRLYISEGSGGAKDLLLHVEDVAHEDGLSMCELWFRDLQQHIKFATENHHLVDIQSKE